MCILKSYFQLLWPLMALLAIGCDTSTWAGKYGDTNGDLSGDPRLGGDPGAEGASFVAWINNAWGPESEVIDPSTGAALKCHPPLRGVEICAVDTSDLSQLEATTDRWSVPMRSDLACAVTDELGRFEMLGMPFEEHYLSIRLDGYYGLLIPWSAEDAGEVVHPSPELPSVDLQQQLYAYLTVPTITEDPSKGSMNIFAIEGLGSTGLEIVAGNGQDDCGNDDHHEANRLQTGVWFRYRRVFNPGPYETFGQWRGEVQYFRRSAPGSWNSTNGEIVYLDAGEMPSASQSETTESGLGLALNLDPGVYEIEATGVRTLLGDMLQCRPILGQPGNNSRTRARTLVVPGHLSDVRFDCD